MTKQESITGNMIGIAALAATFGAVAALLLAPKSGSEMRAELKRRMNQAKDASQNKLNNTKDKVQEGVDKARDKSQEVTSRAKESASKTADEVKNTTKEVQSRQGS